MSEITVPSPELQAEFSKSLSTLRGIYLQDALRSTIQESDIAKIDTELHKFVPKKILSGLASIGLRGEFLFAIPHILTENPRLLGYYRLLLGFSQKAFYVSRLGLSQFKTMEEKGIISAKIKDLIPTLCHELDTAAAYLLEGIGLKKVSSGLLHDLTLLSLGAQLRGGANNQFGVAAIVDVFEIVREIVKHTIKTESDSCIEIRNAARRKVMIEFASDPDIIIKEEMAKDTFRNIIAIEVKGGKDFSNIHNRIGEAEKSHQKARRSGFVECWTVVNVDNIDIQTAKHESPSTNRFYILSNLKDKKNPKHIDFFQRVTSLTGIKSRGRKPRS